ncbi:MAG: response regulator [Planctomycetota bacterium]|nr:response regulator [Planctomycetota bacterium]
MTSHRPRLVVPPGVLPTGRDELDLLRGIFDVVEAPDAAEAQRLAAEAEALVVLTARQAAESPVEGLPSAQVRSILEQIGEGVGVVDADGGFIWANARLREIDELTRQRFLVACRRAMAHFNQAGLNAVPLTQRPGRKFTFVADEAHYEAMISIGSVDEGEQRSIRSVVGILWEVTASRQLQARIDAIDAAGAELMRIEAESVARLNMAERLKLLEDKIVSSVRELLNFENFEIRLIDRETNQLELVIAVGILPLRIGEVIYADAENSGISGYVAVTGESYLCTDVASDPLYREGLDRAASSLTVPLRLFDQVIGVFNVESTRPYAFDENDRRFAEIFGRYIAMAMHILDLLVVERYTTNEQIAQDVLNELNEPLSAITSRAATLRSAVGTDELRTGLDEILEAAGGIRRRLEACITGPKSLLGAEQALHQSEPDPRMIGKRVIVADNEPVVRDAISSLLRQRGCEVTVCSGGAETIEKLRDTEAANHAFDLVICDIRMPDRNGYEVFRAARELSPDMPVILITGFGYDPHHSIVRASQEGLHSFLFKPLRAGQLLEAIGEAFAKV